MTFPGCVCTSSSPAQIKITLSKLNSCRYFATTGRGGNGAIKSRCMPETTAGLERGRLIAANEAMVFVSRSRLADSRVGGIS